MKKEAKQVIVVRKDLNMRKGKIAAQASHASLGALLKLLKPNKQPPAIEFDGVLWAGTAAYQWINGPFTKICVSCDSEAELLALCKMAEDKGILHCLVTDAGRTEFHDVPTITCAAFGPEWSEFLDDLTGHLKLL